MKNDKQVFPEKTVTTGKLGDYLARSEGGLSKRELFAGLAMQGILSNEILMTRYIAMYSDEDDIAIQNVLAEDSLLQADTLIKALAKESEEPEEGEK